MKTIAVITPCYNAEQYLADCVLSVQQSITTSDFRIEHILVDDCSTDRTREVIEGFSFPNIKRIFFDQNRGPAAARNAALQATTADYIFCLDADDVLFQNSLRYLFAQATQLGRPWLYGDFLRSNDQLAYQLGNDYYGYAFTEPAELLTALLAGEHFFQQNSFTARTLIAQVGYYNDSIKLAEDFDLSVRLLLQGTCAYFVPGPLYIHRFHDHNLTPKAYQQNPDRHRQDVLSVYKKYTTEINQILSSKQRAKVEAYLQTRYTTITSA